MNNKVGVKFLLILGVVFSALYMLYPNVVWYSLPLEERHAQARQKNPMAQEVIPLGLDLQGGVHLVYQVDVKALPDMSDATVTRAIEQNITVITNRIDALGVANPLV